MGVASFEKNAIVLIDKVPHTLRRKVDNEYWQLEEERTGRIHEYKIHELQKLYWRGSLTFASDPSLSSRDAAYQERLLRSIVYMLQHAGKVWERAKMRRDYVLAVKDLPSTKGVIKVEIQKVWKKMGGVGRIPHWTTVNRWKQRYIASGDDIFGLTSKDHLKGNKGRRVPKEVIEIIEDSIENIYLTRERKTITDTLDDAVVRVERENKLRTTAMQLPIPGIHRVKRMIDAIDAFDRYAARYGRMAAVRKFRSVLHMNVTDRPLETAELDHTKLDLFVVEDDTGIPLGRPWVAVCIDSNTRCILGIYIGFEPPSYLTVARCLKHAFLPKVDLHERYPDMKNTWDAHGVMDKLVLDNALENHGNSLDAACFSLGIEIQYTPRKTPWWKGKIERVIGTLNRGVAHGNPGTTFANIFEKDDYNPAEHAVITSNILREVVHRWIVDVYHQRPHRSLDDVAPAVKWSSSIAVEDIKLPEDPARLNAIMGRVDHRVLTHQGIELEKLFYNSPDMTNLRRRLGDKLDVELRIDDGDLGRIHVIAPDKSSVISVPCLDPDYADGLSLWQHKVIRRFNREHRKRRDSANEWRHAKVELGELIQNELQGKRKKTGASRLGRFVDTEHANDIAHSAPSKAKVQETSPLPSSPNPAEPKAFPPLLARPAGTARRTFAPIIEERQICFGDSETN